MAPRRCQDDRATTGASMTAETHTRLAKAMPEDFGTDSDDEAKP